MSCLFESKFADDHFSHYFNPGQFLSSQKLQELHQKILMINGNAKNPLEHKLLEDIQNIDELREQYQSMIVCIINVAGVDSGFLISPILQYNSAHIIHAGLVLINHNRGTNLLALAGSRTVALAYQKLGKIYSTNISSTPAIIEAYTKLTANCWPTPKSNLIRPPRDYQEVARILVDRYVKKYFPNSDSVELDVKRFVIRSESRKMGFNTDFRQISRSSSFDYLNFCFTWLDYDKEEDLLQVGVIDRSLVRKIQFWRFIYAWRIWKKQFVSRLSVSKPIQETASISPKEAVK
ncbi:MAG: hypothetical protein ACOH5I_04250 [Oligoflexus sp.]